MRLSFCILVLFCLFNQRQILCAAASSSPIISSVHFPEEENRSARSKKVLRSRIGRSLSPGSSSGSVKPSRFSCMLPHKGLFLGPDDNKALEQAPTNDRLVIPYIVSMAEQRGQVTAHQVVIDLTIKDPISNERLIDHFEKDHLRCLPWPIALFYYQNSDGRLGIDCADGRTWYKFFASVRPTKYAKKNVKYSKKSKHKKSYSRKTPMPSEVLGKHPKTEAYLVGFPIYYLVRKIDKKFDVEFLGMPPEQQKIMPKAAFLRGVLSADQNADMWHLIGDSCFSQGEYDAALEWFNRALEQLQTEDRKYSCILRSIAEVYIKKEQWENALGWLKKAQKRRYQEFELDLNERGSESYEENPDILNLMGVVHEKMDDVGSALKHFLWAIQVSVFAMDPVVNCLCLYANHKDKFAPDTFLDQMHQIASQYLIHYNLPEGKDYLESHLDRCSLAYLTAMKLTRNLL